MKTSQMVLDARKHDFVIWSPINFYTALRRLDPVV